MPEENRATPRPFWSGTITFGLVSVPVNLYPATRTDRASLRTLGPDGRPLSRRYYSQESGRDLPAEETTHAFELEDGQMVQVTGEELERVAPEKSRDIDLRRFVPLDAIAPVYFQRAYFLTPGGSSTKAYRLLARAIEEEGRAGIATFVMRGKEYLVAIMAENGILRAETLRFHDEIRSASDIGLPERREPPAGAVERIVRAIRKHEVPELAAEDTVDEGQERLRELIERKREDEKAIVEAPEAAEEGAEVIDLMERLKRALGEKAPASRGARPAAREAGPLSDLTREQLYERARERDIPGRSSMTKEELIEALRRAA